MKLVTVQAARAIWLFDLVRLNPHGISNKVLIDGVKQRYDFSKSPSSMLDVEDKALVFDQGEFTASDGRRIYVSLKAYSDGLVASTSSSTSDTTDFLEDLGLFLGSLGFSFPSQHQMGRGFTSVLRVESDISLIDINPRMESMIKYIESRLVSLDGKPRKFEAASLGMWSEDATKGFSPAAFKFERTIGKPFESKEYYSEAPLQTHEHLDLLEEMEALFAH